MPTPLCKLIQENPGTTPWECLFGKCTRGCHDEADDGNGQAPAHLGVHCKRCGDTNIRWRQQGGKWILFSLTPGVLHACPIDTSDFGPVPE